MTTALVGGLGVSTLVSKANPFSTPRGLRNSSPTGRIGVSSLKSKMIFFSCYNLSGSFLASSQDMCSSRLSASLLEGPLLAHARTQDYYDFPSGYQLVPP